MWGIVYHTCASSTNRKKKNKILFMEIRNDLLLLNRLVSAAIPLLRREHSFSLLLEFRIYNWIRIILLRMNSRDPISGRWRCIEFLKIDYRVTDCTAQFIAPSRGWKCRSHVSNILHPEEKKTWIVPWNEAEDRIKKKNERSDYSCALMLPHQPFLAESWSKREI